MSARLLALSTAACLAVLQPALAASTFSGFAQGVLSLTAVNGDASGLTFEASVDDDDSDEIVEIDGNAVGDATGSAAFFDSFTVVSASVGGTAFGLPFGSVLASAFGQGSVSLGNEGTADVTLSFRFDYEAAASSGADDDLVEDASAFADVFLVSDTLGELVSISLFADVVGQDDPVSAVYEFDVVLAPGDLDVISAFVASAGLATSVAPIPLPPAAPLLLAALGGLVALRRRARA